MAEQAGFITDPSLIQTLEKAYQGTQTYLQQSPEQRAEQAQRAIPTDATPESVKAAILSGQDPRGQYTGSSYPGEPKTEFMGGVRSGIGTALQVGSSFIPPAMAASGAMKSLQAGGGLARMAGRMLPGLAEGAVAAGGAALGGGSGADVAMAGLLPAGVRAFHDNATRMAARATFGALTPDQLNVAMMDNVAKQYGPGLIPSKLWEDAVRPHNNMYIPAEALTKALVRFELPTGQSVPEQVMASRLQMITDKYNNGMRGKTMSQMKLAPGSFGLPQTTVTLGAMYDDMKQLEEVAGYARKNGFKNYATKIMDLRDNMLDDMTDAVPALSGARKASYQEGNVTRLYDIMDTGKPAVEWAKVKDTPRFRNAFSKSEIADITQTMEIMGNVGGGSHWLGRILGHGIGAAAGGAMGGAVGGGPGAVVGSTLGAISPYILGEVMANAGGRAFLRGLVKKNPVGMTPAAQNALMQWFIAKRRAGEPMPEQP